MWPPIDFSPKSFAALRCSGAPVGRDHRMRFCAPKKCFQNMLWRSGALVALTITLEVASPGKVFQNVLLCSNRTHQGTGSGNLCEALDTHACQDRQPFISHRTATDLKMRRRVRADLGAKLQEMFSLFGFFKVEK